jgi:hypothetical protein
VPHGANTAELLDIDVYEFARILARVAPDRFGWSGPGGQPNESSQLGSSFLLRGKGRSAVFGHQETLAFLFSEFLQARPAGLHSHYLMATLPSLKGQH